MTNDSAAEQLAVKKCFHARGMLSGEMDVQHLLCHKHLDATLRKRFKGDWYKKILECILAAVKYCRTATGGEESLRQAINALPKTGQQSFMDGTLRPKEEDVRDIAIFGGSISPSINSPRSTSIGPGICSTTAGMS